MCYDESNLLKLLFSGAFYLELPTHLLLTHID